MLKGSQVNVNLVCSERAVLVASCTYALSERARDEKEGRRGGVLVTRDVGCRMRYIMLRQTHVP